MSGRGGPEPARGQALMLLLVMMPAFLATLGLLIDAGVVLAARRELQNSADAAAHAGAGQISEQSLRRSDGRRVVLDEARARAVAEEYAAYAPGPAVSTRIVTTPRRIVVRVSRRAPVSFLGLFGVGAPTVTATAAAEVQYGVTGAGE